MAIREDCGEGASGLEFHAVTETSHTNVSCLNNDDSISQFCETLEDVEDRR